MSRWIRCKDCGCDRRMLVLTEDPPRPEGRANYAYVRTLRWMLAVKEKDWRRRTGRKLAKGASEGPPPILRVVPADEKGTNG